MLTFKRTTSNDTDFKNLIVALDKEFWVRYPDTQQNFVPFNYVDERARVVVAYQDGVAVGCGCFRPMNEELIIEIKRMYVDPAVRGKGIGGKVLLELEGWAKEEGFTKSMLETGVKQPEAIRVYQRSGYTIIPNYPPYENIDESICMMKFLVTS